MCQLGIHTEFLIAFLIHEVRSRSEQENNSKEQYAINIYIFLRISRRVGHGVGELELDRGNCLLAAQRPSFFFLTSRSLHG